MGCYVGLYRVLVNGCKYSYLNKETVSFTVDPYDGNLNKLPQQEPSLGFGVQVHSQTLTKVSPGTRWPNWEPVVEQRWAEGELRNGELCQAPNSLAWR